ncbi:MAG TPA: response regulator [Planctomycetota bacterium]|nr:response regulator [Planctomycetota bacterium]
MRDREPLIIVVDPDADFATALSSLLDRRGYHVVRRSFGIDALQYIAEDRPELVLSEVDLPDCDCHELLDSIRTISPTTQVLFISRKECSKKLPVEVRENMVRLPDEPKEAEGILRAVDRLLERVA